MKKAMILFGLLLIAATMFAQVSLLGLEFGASATEIVATLNAKGFKEISREGIIVKFQGGSESGLPDITVVLGEIDDTIVGWELTYDLSKDPALVYSIPASLGDLHGNVSVVDAYDVDYIWYFPNDRALYVDEVEGEKMVLWYGPGNWDDDDYNYYGDYWDF